MTDDLLQAIVKATPDQKAAALRALCGKPEAEKATTVSVGPLLFNMSQAAKFLGVSRTTCFRLVKAGRLSRVELMAGTFRIPRAALEALAAGSAVTA